MAETAVAVSGQPNISIDLTKADKKALKVFERIQERQAWMDYSARAAGGAKDFTIGLLEVVKEHEVLLYALMIVIIYNLIKLKLIDEVVGTSLALALTAAMGLEAVLPEWLT